MKQWIRRAAELRAELAEIADVRDPRWWLVAGGAALGWNERGAYVASDAEPSGDTFMGYVADEPRDPLASALVRAHAARAALRELDGELPGQPLAVTVQRSTYGAVAIPSKLDVAAFAIGDTVATHRLAERLEDETGELVPGDAVPFVTVTVGEEPLESARHGHRRGWRANGGAEGPWLGLGRAGGLSIVSTCHMIVDGYGHAWLAARIAEYAASMRGTAATFATISRREFRASRPSPVAGAIPLAVSWREIESPAPRAMPLAYALGRILHRLAGQPDAPFSPTFQIPVAPGELGDALRFRRRVVPAIASVRFSRGEPEPFDTFAARTRKILAREASGAGPVSRLLAAARGVPMPLAWKRHAVGPERPSWLEPVAAVLGGRGCVSRLKLDLPTPPLCAVSSPARLATSRDDLGGCVVTVVDDGDRAAITLCGSGRASDPALLDELLAFF
ncbi:MAG TPA: hypothetical protein VK932_23910 [Kofleriaceae bacterium]|nr:hypothetical protein [Kofleriaceae bacterium]